MQTTLLSNTAKSTRGPILLLGGSGKSGRRIAERLRALGHPVRIGSRRESPSFDWNTPGNWDAVLAGAAAVYVAYYPDLAVSSAPGHIRQLMEVAARQGVGRLVLLSGRGEEEAQACERIVLNSEVPATVVRCAWFNQNFSEYFLHDAVMSGTIALPAGDIPEPFVDVEDIAEVATVALTEAGHAGKVYELTGPDLLTIGEIAAILSEAIGREVHYLDIPHSDYIAGAQEAGVPEDIIGLLDYLFARVLDGRNSALADGVQQALGRPPRSFASFARDAAKAGVWN